MNRIRYPVWFRSPVPGTSAFLAAAAALLMAISVWAQESPVSLESILPPEGQPGQEVEVTLNGRGFAEANEIHLIVGELEVRESWIISDQQMGAILYIPEGAPPGPRDVQVIANFGQDEEFPAVLFEGFTVLGFEAPPPEESPPPEPPSPGDFEHPPDQSEPGFDGWDGILILLLGIILLSGGTVVIGISLVWRRSILRRKWQAQASESDLPETCQPGTHFVRREKPEIKPGRWKVTGLKITVYDADSSGPGTVHHAPEEVVKKLDEGARQRLLRGMSEALAEEVMQISEYLSVSILSWQSSSRTGDDIYLQTKLEGGQAEQKFIRYRCIGTPGSWQKQVEWSLKLKAVDYLPIVVRGPGADESREAYAAHLNERVHLYLLNMLEESGSLF